MTVCCTTVCSPSLLAINMGSVACKVVLKHNGICRYSLRHCEPVYDVKLSRRKCGAKASLVQRRTFVCVCVGGGQWCGPPWAAESKGRCNIKKSGFLRSTDFKLLSQMQRNSMNSCDYSSRTPRNLATPLLAWADFCRWAFHRRLSVSVHHQSVGVTSNWSLLPL